MRGQETDHVISGSKRGLEKTANKQTNLLTDGHGESMTESAQWGRFSENEDIILKRGRLGWQSPEAQVQISTPVAHAHARLART